MADRTLAEGGSSGLGPDEGACPPDGSYERSLPRARRRAGGVFYTPPALVTRVVDETLRVPLARAAWRADGTPELRILDPAAGDGRFLVACVDRLVAAALARPGRPRDEAQLRRAIVAACVTGLERDPRAAAEASAALGPGADVRVGEALLSGLVEEGAFDAVVGNPPWIRSITLKREDAALWTRLRGRFAATSFGEWDLSAAFVEQALAWAAPDGEIGLVVPSRWLTAAFAAPLRAKLAEARALRRVVDFGATQVFPDATTYTALVFLTRRAGGAGEVEVERVSELAGRPEAQGRLAAASLGGAPWTLEVGATARRLADLRAVGPTLGEIARISKGAGTNADPIFLVPAELAGDLDPASLVPCLRGRDVVPWRAQPQRYAILPYDGDRLLEPEELAARWPRTWAYLLRHRPALEARESGRFAGPTFYRWGRPQNLVWLRDVAPKVIVPDAARRGRAVLDDAGTMVIDTAYAVRPLDPARTPVGLLLAVLNSPVVASWLSATGVPLRGGYFRMKTAYLSSLPVPDPSHPAAQRLSERALAAARGEEDPGTVEAALAELYG